MARTAACFLAPTRQRVAGVKTGCSCHFRRPFFGSSFGRTKKEQIKKTGANLTTPVINEHSKNEKLKV